jgi:SOS regulatory protein LexA
VFLLPEFDKKEFGRLLDLAKGARSINNFAARSGVDSAHISRLIRGIVENPPTPQTIKKIADQAHNDVQYKDLMIAAGHFDPEEANYHENKELTDFVKRVVLKSVYGDKDSPDDGPSLLHPALKAKIKEYAEQGEDLAILNLINEKIIKGNPRAGEYFLNGFLAPHIIPVPASLTVDDLQKVDNVLRIPVLGHIAAGLPILAQEHIESYVDIVNPNNFKESELFILIVKGDSMTGSRIYEGDKVVVKIQPDVENGEIAVVNVNGDEATLKKVKKYEDGSVWLISTNEKYAPIPLNHSKARVIGKVIQVIFEP